MCKEQRIIKKKCIQKCDFLWPFRIRQRLSWASVCVVDTAPSSFCNPHVAAFDGRINLWGGCMSMKCFFFFFVEFNHFCILKFIWFSNIHWSIRWKILYIIVDQKYWQFTSNLINKLFYKMALLQIQKFYIYHFTFSNSVTNILCYLTTTFRMTANGSPIRLKFERDASSHFRSLPLIQYN